MKATSQTLSQCIIYGSDAQLKEQLAAHTGNLNYIDEYGYSPLIQAVIVNSIAKTRAILQCPHVEVDFTDLTGRTALFWAAENSNVQLCELLLQYGANPNAYSLAGQPLLAMPLLKRDQSVQDLLLKHGAVREFAQDFIDAKIIGHCFELEGRVDIVDTQHRFIEIELEGFYLKFTLEIIAELLHRFRESFFARSWEQYFPAIKQVICALARAAKLLSWQNYLLDLTQVTQEIDQLLEEELLILPLACSGHAITLIRYHDYLIRCDRGAFGRQYGGVNYYRMLKPQNFTVSWCRDLLYKRQYQEVVDRDLMQRLGLQQLAQLAIPVQITGNCSWANVEAVFPALLYFFSKQQLFATPKVTEVEILKLYHSWNVWNRRRFSELYLNNIRTLPDMPRQIAHAALLAAIFFQYYCVEENHDEMTNKILVFLHQPQYLPILQRYQCVLQQFPNYLPGKRFADFLKNYDILSA